MRARRPGDMLKDAAAVALCVKEARRLRETANHAACRNVYARCRARARENPRSKPTCAA